MENIYKCPKCGETELFQFTYDYSKAHRPVVNILCNNCGEMFPPALKLPKEASKQETTLEEAARKYANIIHNRPLDDEERYYKDYQKYDGFVAGAKYQAERMYSEEDLKEAFEGGGKMCWSDIEQESQEPYYYDFKEWFEQFKKK
jgi:hypothetical protein